MTHSTPVLVREIRVAAGVVLLTYVTLHLLNHALGLVSLDAMEWGRTWFLALWRTVPGTIALYGALLAHLVLALWLIARRQHFRLPAWETTQMALGLLIPLLLMGHVAGTRLAATWYGATDSYTRQVLDYWTLRPAIGVAQAVLLVVAWVHGCMGMHFWLRFHPWYPRAAPLLFAVAILLPVLALLGFAEAGKEIAARAAQPGWIEETLRRTGDLDAAQVDALLAMSGAILGLCTVGAGLAVCAPVWRRRRALRRAMVRITYGDGREIAVPAGFTVLEASRFAGIAHTAVCGGRGRCSTCRVLVLDGAHRLPPATVEEARVLARISALPNVRLACQLAPAGDVSVALLVGTTSRQQRRAGVSIEPTAGEEREIAVLFADLRGFTAISERKLPYDVVLILNRYCEAAAGAIESAGGVVNQFTGDGVMALFGLTTDPPDACRAALHAARAIGRSLAALSETLAAELDGPLRAGIGIHTGPAVVGHMGHGRARYLTAVGDTVHVASRLEQLTKDYRCALVISEPVAALARLDVETLPRVEVSVRNRSEPLAVRTIDDLEVIGPLLR